MREKRPKDGKGLAELRFAEQIPESWDFASRLEYSKKKKKIWALPAALGWLWTHLVVPILPPHSQMSPATLRNSLLASHSLAWASNGQGKQTRNYHLEQTSDYLSSNCYEHRTQERAAACFTAFIAGSDCYGMKWPFHLAVNHRARWCQVAWTVGKKLEHLWPTHSGSDESLQISRVP